MLYIQKCLVMCSSNVTYAKYIKMHNAVCVVYFNILLLKSIFEVCLQLDKWKRLCSVSILHLDLKWKKKEFFPKIGCNLQMNFLHARLLHKSICPDSDWTQLNDSIHIPDFFTRQCFSFSQTEKSKISMFSGATSVTDWPFFFSCHQPLVRLATGTKWHWKSLCSFEDKGGPIEVTKLCYTKYTISVVFVLFPNWIQIHVIAEKISKRNCLLVILLVMVILCARFKLSGEICIKFHIFGTLINKKRNTHTRPHAPAIRTSKITACYDVKNCIDTSWHDVF